MYRIGLKLWSTNTDPLADAAARLFEDGVFAYIELFVVPGSSETLPAWTRLHADYGIPFVIHNAHTAQGFNLAKREMEGAMSLGVPLEVSVGVGSNWLEAH